MPVHIDIRQYAALFERLAIRYLSDELGVTPNYLERESVIAVDDDRVITFSVANTTGKQNLTVVSTRLTREDIGIAAIRRPAFIAINRNAGALYIVTSAGFESAAVRNLVTLAAKGARVTLVNGATLADWVGRARRSLQDIGEALLDYLLEQVTQAQPIGAFIVDARTEAVVATGVSTITAPLRYAIDLGSRGQLLPIEASAPPELPPLIGDRRRNTLEEITTRISEQPGIGILTGGAGVGKSVFVAHLRQKLVERDIQSTTIDLTGITSRRVYFLRLLSALTGVDLEILAGGEDAHALAAALIEHGDEQTAAQREAVAALMTGSMAAFEAKSDVNVALVNRFIGVIASQTARRELFVFQNLERSVREVLDILPDTARSLLGAGLSTMFEVRRFGEAGTGSAEEILSALLSAREWGVVLSRLADAATYPSAEIMPLDTEEALAYVESLLPGFGRDRGELIVRAVGTNPLLIRSAVVALQKSGIVTGPAHAAVIAKVEQFFSDITPGNASAVLHRHIGLWWDEFRDLLAATTLTDGQLTFGTLALLRPDEMSTPGRSPGSGIATDLIKTRLFEIEPGRPDAVRIVHGVVSREIRRIVDGEISEFADGPIALYDAARPLTPHLEAVLESAERALRKRPFFLAAIGDWDAATAALDAARERAASLEQWADVSSLDVLALRAVQFRTLADAERSRQRVAILVDLLGAERSRERLALDVNRPYVEQLARDVRADPQFDHDPALHGKKIRALHLETRHHFIREEFDRAYDAARLESDLAWKWRDEVGDRTCARAFVDCALALKGLERRGESIELFDDACARMPGNVLLINERLSNWAALELLREPGKARERYVAILASEISDGDDGEQLHARVDVAMADFLDRRYERAEEEARQTLSIALQTNEYAQIARARNILGCCEWVRGDLPSADASFEAGAVAAERTLVNRYLWRVRINRAGTALAVGLRDLALGLARTAGRTILEPRRGVARDIARRPEHRQSRWYAGLIAAGVYLSRIDVHEFDLYIAEMSIPTLANDCLDAAAGTYASPAFSGTTHLHVGQIMIT
jgi:tetratricopeptide (TPR) repeat protein